jgi:hypothetical protein
MRCIAAGVLTMTLLTAPLVAQVNSRPTDPPIVTAENDSWYRRGEPVVFAGEFYYPTGPTVFFNGNVMFREGDYYGVPLYADATIEPYSVLFVPVGRNLMRPYERRRSGDLAGTTGSRAPSFPGVSVYASRETDLGADSLSDLPEPFDEFDVFPAERAVGTTGRLAKPVDRAIGEVPTTRTPARRGRPFSYDSVSVQFQGERWVMAGPMTEMPSGLVEVAEYKGFPVYAQKGKERARIYLPLVPGRVAPFTPKR